MNTYVRALPDARFATRVQTQQSLFKQSIQVMVLMALVFVSAFAVVYVKDLHRRMFIQYQTLQDQQNQIYVDWGKLLLEQSTWSTQARIQSIAAGRLQMQVPQNNAIVMVD